MGMINFNLPEDVHRAVRIAAAKETVNRNRKVSNQEIVIEALKAYNLIKKEM